MKLFRVNGRIKAPEVRVITEDNTELGVYSLEEAWKLAQARKIDLVEIGPDDDPPTCLMIDYGHFLFQQRQPRDNGMPPERWKE
jgi:translation initiation factor IF-3